MPVAGPFAVEIGRLVQRYTTPGGVLTVLDHLDLAVEAGEHLGIIGPSGSASPHSCR